MTKQPEPEESDKATAKAKLLAKRRKKNTGDGN